MVPSSVYELFVRAMAERKQIVCTYGGLHREVCPIILGWAKDGVEAALTYQFAGTTSDPKGLPRGGDWKCMHLRNVRDAGLRDGPWHAGNSHSTANTCVKIVDLDVNPDSPYNPRRRLSDLDPTNQP
jgi:hypothetical protein